MGYFFAAPTSKRKTTLRDMRRFIRKKGRGMGLDVRERQEIINQLKKYKSGGLTQGEVSDAFKDLKYQHDDSIEKYEAQRTIKTLDKHFFSNQNRNRTRPDIVAKSQQIAESKSNRSTDRSSRRSPTIRPSPGLGRLFR